MKKTIIGAISLVFVLGCGGGGGGSGEVPAAPTGVTVTLGEESGKLVVSWDEVTDATSYNLYWGAEEGVTVTASAGVPKAVGTQIAGVTSPYSHEGLTDGERYYYIVTAVNAAGEGAASMEASGVPKVALKGVADSSFDADGRMFYDGADVNIGAGIAVDSDGKIVVAGTILDSVEGYNMALWRYNPDGTPDAAFGTNGLVTHHGAAGGNKWDWGTDVAIDDAGRILVTGYSDNAADLYEMLIWRFNGDGSIDTTFGTNGIVRYDHGIGANNFGYGIALDSSGNIVVVGACNNGATNKDDMFLWRYDVNGNPDTTFGTNGVVISHNAAGGNGADSGFGLAIDGEGRLVVVGESVNAGGDFDIAVWRYDSTGMLDTAFNGMGIATYGGANDDRARGVAIDASNRVLVVGSLTGGTSDVVALMYAADGTLDPSFDTDGIFTYDSGNEEMGSAVAFGPRGGAIIAGSTEIAADTSSMLAIRFTAGGEMDASFGTGGIVTNHNDDVINSEDAAADIAFDQAGRAVITGRTGAYSAWDMAIWRYQ